MKVLLLSISLLLGITPSLYSQDKIQLSGQSLTTFAQILSQPPIKSLFGSNLNLPLLKKAKVSEENNTIINTSSQKMPLVYAYKDLALFCKIEVKLEKVVKMPIKFRLGSVDYVDWLEGKRDRY